MSYDCFESIQKEEIESRKLFHFRFGSVFWFTNCEEFFFFFWNMKCDNKIDVGRDEAKAGRDGTTWKTILIEFRLYWAKKSNSIKLKSLYAKGDVCASNKSEKITRKTFHFLLWYFIVRNNPDYSLLYPLVVEGGKEKILQWQKPWRNSSS